MIFATDTNITSALIGGGFGIVGGLLIVAYSHGRVVQALKDLTHRFDRHEQWHKDQENEH